MNKIPVGKTIEYAYSFTFGNLLTLFGLSWFAFLIMTGPQLLIRQLYPNSAVGFGTGQTLAMATLLLLFAVFGWIVIAMTKVAFLRQALGLQTGGAVFYFSLGADVWRVIGAYLLMFVIFTGIYLGCLLVFAIIGALLGVIVGVALGAAGAPLAANAGIAIGIILLVPAFLLGILYFILRFGFFLSTIVVAEERIGIGHGWRLTRGNFWRVLGVVLAIDVPILIVYVTIILWVLGFNFMPPIHAGVTPAEMNAWAQGLAARAGNYWMIFLPAYFMVFVISTGLTAAASAYAYRTLAPREDIAAHFT